MGYKRLIEQIQDSINFGAFVNENMKNSTYKIGWNNFMDVEYTPSRNLAEFAAQYQAAMVGTVVATGADAVKHGMPDLGIITGSVFAIKDEWQLPNQVLEQYYFMEDRYRNSMGNAALTEANRNAQYKSLVKYLFNPYELASIAPHRRLLDKYMEGLSTGYMTLTASNNPRGMVANQMPIGAHISNIPQGGVAWSSATLATMSPLSVMRKMRDDAEDKGKEILSFKVSQKTANLILECNETKNLFGVRINKNNGMLAGVAGTMVSLSDYNLYIDNLGFAPIEIVKEKAITSNGAAFSMFRDNSIVAQCAERVAVLKVMDALEKIDPVPGKIYTDYADNLIYQYRDNNGRYVGYEMNAAPLFTGADNIFIVKTDTVDQ